MAVNPGGSNSIVSALQSLVRLVSVNGAALIAAITPRKSLPPLVYVQSVGAFYYLNTTDTTSADNGNTIIVNRRGARYYQIPSSAAINQKPTGQFFQDNGAVIDRFNDRVFVGPATVNDGNFPNVVQDWLAIEIAPDNPVEAAQMAVLSQNGLAGFVAASRTSDQSSPTSSIAAEFFGLNDSAAGGESWGLYVEGRRIANTSALTFAAEFDVANQQGVVQNNPFAQNAGATVALQLASGSGLPLPGNATTSAALQIQANPTVFDKGIIFGSNSIFGTDGITGAGVAMAFAKGHTLTWFNSTGNETTNISSSASAATGPQASLLFTDSGFVVANASDNTPSFVVAANAGSASYAFVDNIGGTIRLSSSVGDLDLAAASGQVSFVNASDDSLSFRVLTNSGATGYIYAQYSAGMPSLVSVGGDMGLIPATGLINFDVNTTPSALTGSAGALPALPALYMQIKIFGTVFRIPCYN
jgi:hypothetical protein